MSNLIVGKKIIKGKIKNLFNVEDAYVGINTEDLPPYVIYEPASYRDGPEGFIKWCNENVNIPIYPVGAVMAQWCPMGDLPRDINPRTGKSYRGIWDAQKEVVRQALRMVDGEFIYRLIVLCWMRGEGKSLLADPYKMFWTAIQRLIACSTREDEFDAFYILQHACMQMS